MHTTALPTPRSWRRRTSVLALVAAATLVAACGSSTANGSATSKSSTSTSSGTSASANQVDLKLIAYKPAKLAVSAGTTVTWVQMDPGAHTVTSGTVAQGAAGVTEAPDQRFASGELSTGQSFKHTFSEPGTYRYFCEIHPATMQGDITVR